MSTDSNRSTRATVAAETASPRAPGVLSALAQFARSRLSRDDDTAARLGIDALPGDLATLEHGALYAVQAAPRSPECDALIWETVRAAGKRPVTVVLARERGDAAARLRELGLSGSATPGWPRRLNVLAMPGVPDAAADNEAPPALARLFGGLLALRRFGLRRDALYIVEGAQRWFTWSDTAALVREGRLLADWCATRGVTMLLLLGDNAAAPESDVSPDFDEAADKPGGRELNGACAGVARVRRANGELLWQVNFWRAGKALVTGDVRALRFTGDGRLSVASPDTQSGAMRIAHDEDRVVVCRAVTGDEPWVPRNWEVLDDRDAVVAACRDARAATVLLAHRNGAQLEQLCEAVHALRRRSGRALKIVVVERGEVLRHQYELLMLSLGANAVVGRDTPFSRLESIVQSVQGQLYTRPLMPDYRAALAASLADAALGYLNVAAFCAQAQAALTRGAMLRLPHVLAKLALPPSLAHVDALGHCRPRRAGDVFTADATHCYVFLFGCRLSDADAALARIFTAPVESIAEKVTYLSNEGIAAELDALDAANRRAPSADYSDLFATATPAHKPAAAAEPDSVRRARAELDALHDVLEHEARRQHADLTVDTETATHVRRAVRARMPLVEPGN
ncbi:cellulose biosynthesis protein BcsE [Caballeronia sp. LZ019]|uniref:cellulose biosynthesis protein BcsE n=1 Tax=Caballeronia sp. LZ019 TaxID=3038555 RepID=UPI00285ECED7|nr:cellulose biosynthesis protein BcsE [Caballeronia sp. LZ019]MDR5806935.1 cellulose biosynthesis protein BcsE [Caballeronia sp. LZ019]